MKCNQDEQTRLATQKNALYRAEAAEKERDALRAEVDGLAGQLTTRADSTQLIRWQRAADAVGVDLDTWVRGMLDAAATTIERSREMGRTPYRRRG